MFPPQTRTKQTTAHYLRRAATLARRAKAELGLGLSEPLDPRQFVAWLAERKDGLTKPSWRQYKSAAVCHLEHLATDAALEARDWLLEIDSEGCARQSDKTSATKLKRLPSRDFQKLTDHLRQGGGKWHAPLCDWVVSGMLTGLRPLEWAHADLVWIGSERALSVRNAKATNGRAHGKTRTILLGGLAAEELETIERHLNRAKTWDGMGQYPDFYEGCSQTINYVCRKLWPRRSKHITLYSCRHQFSANAKASGFSREEIAAMMGHAVDTTATRHYGRKVAGEELLRVRAVPEEVERVRSKFDDSRLKKARPEPQPKPRLEPNPQSPFAGPIERLF